MEFIIRLPEQVREKIVILGHAAFSSNMVKLRSQVELVRGMHAVQSTEHSFHLLRTEA